MKVKTKGPFKTKAHQVICKKAGEVILMPREDYEEVADLCEILEEDRKPVSKGSKPKKRTSLKPLNKMVGKTDNKSNYNGPEGPWD